MSLQLQRHMLQPEIPAASRQIHQAIPNRVDHQFRCFMDTQRVHNIGPVHRDSVGTQIQIRSDLLVRFSGDDVLQNFQFARG
jgi:hypothetical protein